jgi:hypothetical protein
MTGEYLAMLGLVGLLSGIHAVLNRHLTEPKHELILFQ